MLLVLQGRKQDASATSNIAELKFAQYADDEESTVSRLRRALSLLPDLERGVTRILHKTASPAELLTFLQACSTLLSKLKMQVRESGCNFYCLPKQGAAHTITLQLFFKMLIERLLDQHVYFQGSMSDS